MSDVTTGTTKDTATATTIVDATPEEVFDYLRQPANHLDVNGDGTVKGTVKGPEKLGDGDRFGMNMKLGLPYRITSKVVEFEDGRRLAWSHPLGHRWRWEIEPAGEGRSKVTETFDMTTAKVSPALRMMGYPKKHEANVGSSVANVAAHFARGS